jgi:hypothetical protein
MHIPVIKPMLPLREPFSHERPMSLFLDRNHEVGAGQVIDGTLLGEPIGAASSDFHLSERMQREGRDRGGVVRPAFQGDTT